jgi:hypothetical protein
MDPSRLLFLNSLKIQKSCPFVVNSMNLMRNARLSYPLRIQMGQPYAGAVWGFVREGSPGTGL